MAPREDPRIIVQSDWDQVLREHDGKAWVSVRQAGHESVYGELHGHGISDENAPCVSASEGFQIDSVARRDLEISYRDASRTCRCQFRAPLVSISTVHRAKKSVLSVDVTEGGLGVSADTDGKLHVWTTNSGEIRRSLEGHYGDVYTCRFFPSGIVVLSGGADMQLKIWSAETGLCAATLIGHKSGVTDTGFVERGRNIISSSRDGTVKLWDCGTQTCIHTIDEIGGIVNGCSLGVPGNNFPLGQSTEPSNERACMTEGKLVLVACENGTLQGYGLQSGTKVFGMPCSDAVNCCTFVTSSLVACGTQSGEVYMFDIRNTSMPLLHSKEGRSAVLSMMPHQLGVYISTGDGSCFFLNELLDSSLELTGPDCDPVYKVASDGRHIFTGCRDGQIRKYNH